MRREISQEAEARQNKESQVPGSGGESRPAMAKTLTTEEVYGISQLAGLRAQNLFLSHQMHCSEAVLVTLNRALDGGLREEQALALAAPFAEGIGGSGCLCGALSGALMSIGLLVGRGNPIGHRKETQKAAGNCIKRFKLRFGSACCRILSKKGGKEAKAHFSRCSELTAEAARLSAELILKSRPELIERVEFDFLNERDSVVGGFLKSTARRMKCRLA
jgi:C_GCAxxG_C_C family probable redox protein